MIRLSQLTTSALQILGTLFILSLLVGTVQAAPDSVMVITAGQDEDRAILLANANKALGDANVGIADHDVADINGFDPTATIVCLEQGEECRHLVRQAPAKWLLLLRLKRESDDPDADHRVIASLFSAEDGKLLQAKQAVCQSCSSKERMANIITQLVSELAQAELATRAKETYITVNATPAQAILKIDGQVVGPCGQAYQVPPGEHRIEVTVEGYHGVKQSVLVAANENKSISITLSIVGSDTSDGSGILRPLLTYGAIAGGAIALGAGGYLVAIDSEPAGTGTLHDTKTPGIASLVVGTALVGAGILLLLTGDDDKTDDNKTAFWAIPVPRGFSLGLSASF